VPPDWSGLKNIIMAEKHLTELPWKTLVMKTKVKDPGLQKALLAYSKLDPKKDAAQAVDALQEITDQATKIKKANSALGEVTEYLEEVIKEAAKTKKALAPLAKGADAPAEPKPAPASPAAEPEEAIDLSVRLINSMRAVKSAGGKESIAFVACVAKPFYGVLMGRNSGDRMGVPQKKELTDLTKATRFIEGKCLFENEAHTFILETVPPGLAKNLKKALKQYTDVSYKIRVRDLEGKVVVDADADVDPEEQAATAAAPGASPNAPAPATAPPPGPTAPPTPAPPLGKQMEQKVQFEEAKFKLRQRIDELRAKAASPEFESKKNEALTMASGLLTKGDLGNAKKLLDELAAKLAAPAASPASRPPSPPPATEAPKAPPPSPKLSAYMNTTKEWRDAKKAAANGVFALKNAIFAACDPELKDPVKARIDELNSILALMDDAIIAKIQDASSEADEERQVEKNKMLAQFAEKQMAALRSHPLAPVADNNPFGTFTICSPVQAVLTKISTSFAG
jgi:hypothetical protein